MVIFIALIVMSIMAAIAGSIASGKGRSVAGWAFTGAFFGLLGIIIVASLPAEPHSRKANEVQA